MYGIAILAASLTAPVQPMEIPKDAWELDRREMALPFRLKPKAEGQVKRVRFFVSQNGGKTWEHIKDCTPDDNSCPYVAPNDGLFCFAIQVLNKDGTYEPAKLSELRVGQQVYVNTERQKLQSKKSNVELCEEIEELRATVKRLKEKIAEMEEER